mmetsp:Transcript_18745/g.39008  ORF Transcript_18745/g.39008 Transcript_18745/m.39008 type:complete len:322 (-) Transcript_18745:1764-2729(-)
MHSNHPIFMSESFLLLAKEDQNGIVLDQFLNDAMCKLLQPCKFLHVTIYLVLVLLQVPSHALIPRDRLICILLSSNHCGYSIRNLLIHLKRDLGLGSFPFLGSGGGRGGGGRRIGGSSRTLSGDVLHCGVLLVITVGSVGSSTLRIAISCGFCRFILSSAVSIDGHHFVLLKRHVFGVNVDDGLFQQSKCFTNINRLNLVIAVEACQSLREADHRFQLADGDAVGSSVASETVSLPKHPVALDESLLTLGGNGGVEGPREADVSLQLGCGEGRLDLSFPPAVDVNDVVGNPEIVKVVHLVKDHEEKVETGEDWSGQVNVGL